MLQDTIQKDKIPFKVMAIAHSLVEAGGRAFIVGGALRDLLLGLKPSDWDIATDLVPTKVLSIFPQASTVGIEFGRLSLGDVDIVSLRQESSYRDSRHPSRVSFRAPLEKDLERRDFTANSMALDPFTLEIFDPFGGMADLSLGILAAVGDPKERFKEDPLRILRAIRLKTELGFNLDPKTRRAVSEMADLVKSLSSERVFKEFTRIVLSNAVYQGVMDLYFYGPGSVILPFLFNREPEEMQELALAVSYCPKDLPVRLAVLFSKNTQNHLDQLSHILNLPLDLAEEVKMFHTHCRPKTIPDADDLPHKAQELPVNIDLLRKAIDGQKLLPEADYLVRKILWDLEEDFLFRIIGAKMAIWKAGGQKGLAPGAEFLLGGFFSTQGKGIVRKLEIDGNEVKKALGIEPGPVIGEAMLYLKEAVLRDPALNQKDTLTRLLCDWWKRKR